MRNRNALLLTVVLAAPGTARGADMSAPEVVDLLFNAAPGEQIDLARRDLSFLELSELDDAPPQTAAEPRRIKNS